MRYERRADPLYFDPETRHAARARLNTSWRPYRRNNSQYPDTPDRFIAPLRHNRIIPTP